jgi:hypothetical protein
VHKTKGVLTLRNIHRLLIVSVIVKILDDEYYKNTYYATIGGLSVREFNQLEMEFLMLIKFHMYIDPDMYENVCHSIANNIPISSGHPLYLSGLSLLYCFL